MLKKMTSFLLVFVMALSISSVSAMAAETAEDTTRETSSDLNEYEQVKELQAKSDKELSKLGLNETEIQELKSFSYEEALLERSKLSTEELIDLGYTSEQILILRNYNGEKFSSTRPMAQVVPKPKGNVSYLKNQNGIRVRYSWEWNVAPVNYFTDIVGVRSQLNNTGSQAVSSEIKGYKYGVAYYSKSKGTGVTKTAKTLSVTTEANLQNPTISAKFSSCIGTTTEKIYPYTGYIEMDIGPVTPVTVKSAQGCGGYGHAVVSVSPSVSLGTGVSISFLPAVRVKGYIEDPTSRTF